MQKYFARIEVGGVKYYLLTELYDKGKNGFDLTVCNGEDVWRESVDSRTIESMAKTADMNVSVFADETGRALTGQTVGQDNFVYQAKLKGSNLQFSWKKHVGDGVKFQLGSLSLSKVCNDSVLVISSIFDLAVDQMTQLKQEMSSLRSDNARLSSERKDALKLLDKCVTAKEEMEKDLFEKFAAVLNDKKSKIRQLKELGNKIADSPNQSNSHDQRKGKSKGKTNRHEDSEDDTDIEKMELEDSPVADSMKGSEQKPASSCFSPSLLPEEENEGFEPTVKRRRRRDPKPKESPAAKLVLPKVPSVKKTPSSSSGESSTSSRSRLRQRNSEKSLPDADDLMAEMEL